MKAVDLRIDRDIERGRRVTFRCDGRAIVGYEGESIAAALWAAGMRMETSESKHGPPYRVLFCAMGICQQCVVVVDGVRVEACRMLVSDGVDVRTAT